MIAVIFLCQTTGVQHKLTLLTLRNTERRRAGWFHSPCSHLGQDGDQIDHVFCAYPEWARLLGNIVKSDTSGSYPASSAWMYVETDWLADYRRDPESPQVCHHIQLLPTQCKKMQLNYHHEHFPSDRMAKVSYDTPYTMYPTSMFDSTRLPILRN